MYYASKSSKISNSVQPSKSDSLTSLAIGVGVMGVMGVMVMGYKYLTRTRDTLVQVNPCNYVLKYRYKGVVHSMIIHSMINPHEIRNLVLVRSGTPDRGVIVSPTAPFCDVTPPYEKKEFTNED